MDPPTHRRRCRVVPRHAAAVIIVIALFTGNYKVEVFDNRKSQYVPTNSGLGMFVEVKDPDEKIIMSRVSGRRGDAGQRCALNDQLAASTNLQTLGARFADRFHRI